MLLVFSYVGSGGLSFLFPPQEFSSTISGTVYEDSNGNEVFDVGEMGLDGVSLYLYNETGLVASNITDADGGFSFVVSELGNYTLVEEDPEYWYSTTPNEFEVSIEERTTQSFFVDFGDKRYNASILGVVYDDSDFDGVQDPGEDGIPGVGVGIYSDGSLLNQTDTDLEGSFSFTLYQPGVYEVVETDSDGWESTTDNNVTVVIASIAGDVFWVSFGDTDAERSEIRCVLFNDTDADGVKRVDEMGIPGVSVELYDSEGLVSSQETGAEGVCSFTMEQIGEYSVVEAGPEGWQNTTRRDALVVIGSLYAEVVDVEFGETLGASILGKVYDDNNTDGAWEVDEEGIENVTVSLYRNDALVDVFNTGDSGNFSFHIMEPGSYQLNETDLPGWNSTTPNIVNVTIESLVGQEYYVLFGDKENVTSPIEPEEPEEPEPATLYGVVYRDINLNKTLESFEYRVPGVAVRLYLNESLVAVDTTNSSGSYEFSGLDPGVYVVVETDLSGWYSLTPNRVEVELAEGESVRVDFADDIIFTPPPPPPQPKYGSISGLVFHDMDGDGEYDPEEPGLENVAVSLYKGTNHVSSDTTDSNGTFSFPSVTTGNYRVEESDPAGWYSTTPNSVTLTVSEDKVTNVVFGDTEYSSVWGYAFNDTNGNGEKDEEFGIPGVNVSANFGGEILNAITDEGGYYLFDNLNYTGPFNITADLPEGHFRTTPGLVFWDLYGGDHKKVSFGYAPDGSTFGVVYGTVFGDEDHDGTQELGESGIPEVAVQLYYETGLIDEVVTNFFGQYTLRTSFGGGHDLAEFDLPGYISTTPNNLSVSLTIGSSGPSPVDFGDFYGTIITGMVFNDTDVDGVWDEGYWIPEVWIEGEPGLAGAIVSCGGDSFNTSSDGSFILYVSGTGSFNLTETDPSGYVSTNAVPGSSNVSKVDTNWLSVQIDSPGTTISGNLFGDVKASEVWMVSGVVFDDLNANGQNDDEPGLPGAVVNVTSGMNQTTAVDGLWLLYYPPDTSVNVTETNPAGYVSTNAIPGPDSVKISNDKVMVNVNGSSVIFGDASLSDVAIVSGYVFYDEDENGVYNASGDDFGIPGMNVTMELPVDFDTTIEIWTLTDLNGSYQFAVYPGTDVKITSSRPEGHYPTTIESLVLSPPSAGVYPDNNFGYSNDTDTAVITGIVYHDWDSDGEIDFGEGGLAGANVSLFNESVVLKNVTTSSNGLTAGTFTFRVNETGLYGLLETNPAGFRSTTPDYRSLYVSALGEAYHVEFGDTNRTDRATIYGTVFNDTDGDGLQSLGEPGIPGVNVTLDDTFSAKTNGYGVYSFSTETDGLHSLNESDLPGWISTTPNDHVFYAETGHSYAINFGDSLPTSIMGRIFIDENMNGIIDLGEGGIPNSPVYLILNNTYYVLGETNSSGYYDFIDIAPGEYRVVGMNASLYPGIFNSTPTDVTVLAEAGGSYTVDMGYLMVDGSSAIIGTVSLDLNVTGMQMPFDMGIPLSGVEVTLENSTWSQSNFTNVMGMYMFMVSPGDYNVTEIDPDVPGLYSTTPNLVEVTVGELEVVTVDFVDTFNRSGLISYAFNDTTMNGRHDGGEAFIPDVEIRVYNGTELLLSSLDAVDIGLSGFGLPLPFMQPDIFSLIGFNPLNPFGGSLPSGGGFPDIFGGIPGLPDIFGGIPGLPDIFGGGLPDIFGGLFGGGFPDIFGGGLPDIFGGLFGGGFPDIFGGIPGFPDIFGGILGLPDLSSLFNLPDLTSGLAPAFNVSWFSSGVLEMDGIYIFLLDPGNYTVVEIDPEGYISTTPNSVDVEVSSVNFMDIDNLPNVTFGDVKEYTSLWVDKQIYGQMIPESILSTLPSLQDPFNIFYALLDDYTSSTWRDFVVVYENETVEFRYVVKNNGTTRLSNITIVDDTYGALTPPLTTLEPGEEIIVYLNATAELGRHENIVEVNATYLGSRISVWDNATYLGLGPVPMNDSISKQVSTSPDGPWSEHVNVTAGEDTVYFNVTIVNTSNETIEDLVLYDFNVGELTLPTNTLAPGEKIEKIYNLTAAEGLVENMAAMCATLPMSFGFGIEFDSYMIATDNASYTGIVKYATFYGSVFNDSDGDGVRDFDELGISGVNVTLDGVTQNTTDVNGGYVFATKIPGVHTINETDLPGWVSTTPNEVHIDAELGSSYAVNFGDARPTSISGHIFVDNNTNGVYDSGEYGLPGFPVFLLINNTYYYVASANASGYYEFSDTPPNDYRVVGLNVSQFPWIQNSTSTDVAISAEGGASYTVDMGYYVALTNMSAILCQVNLEIGGFGQGAQPFSVPGLALTGVEVTLENSTMSQTNVTDWMGMCFFPVSPGDYNLTETDPDIPGLYSASPNRVNVTVGAMEIAWVDFNDSLELSGLLASVYNDTNVNGTLDGGEWFIPDVDIRVYNGSKLVASSDDAMDIYGFSFPLPDFGGSGALLDVTMFFSKLGFNPMLLDYFQTSIDLSGLFKLADIRSYMRLGFNVSWFGSGIIKSPYGYLFLLPPGNYTVVEIDPDGYVSTTPNSVEVEAELFDLSNIADITSFPWALFGDVKEATSLTVEKEVLGLDGFWHEAAQVLTGEPVQYRFTLNNTGTTDITDIQVHDSILGAISIPSTSLEPSEGMVATLTSTAAESGYHDNVVEANGTYGEVEAYDSDIASYMGVTAPEATIDVEKYVSLDASGPWAEQVFVEQGYPVYFKVVVNNTGDVPLDEVSIHDSMYGPILSYAHLEPGEELVEYYQEDYPYSGYYVNWAYASGAWHGNQTVWTSARDNASYTAYIPDLMVTVTKNVSTSMTGPWVSHVDVDVGDTVYYRLNITNVGEKGFELEEVKDSLEGYLPIMGILLDPGESEIYNYDTQASDEGTYTNEVSVLGVHYGPMTYGDWDYSSASYTAVLPEVSISVNKTVAPTSQGPWLEHVNKIEGGTIYYNVTVTNTGEAPLDDVDVIDSDEGTLWSDAYLAVGESMSTTYSATVQLGEHNNTVEVEGTWSFWPLYAQDEDNASYTGLYVPTMSMTVEKKVSDSSTGPWLSYVEVMAGEDLVYYNVTVTNTGEVTLSNIYVEDDYPNIHQLTMPNTTLAPGESMSTTYNHPAEYDYQQNTVDVSGAGYNETTIYVDNSSSAAYTGVPPIVDVSVEKKVSNSSTGPWYEHVDVIAGEDLVYFNVTVTNIGEVPLEDIYVRDYSTQVGSRTISMPSTLDPGASMSATYNHPPYKGEVDNEVTVHGNWHSTYLSYYESLFESDTASYTGVLLPASISIEKQASNISATGPWYEHVEVVAGEDLIYYNVTVTNTGDAPLRGIDVIDYDLGILPFFMNLELSPGESSSEISSYPADLGDIVNTVWVEGQWYTTHHWYTGVIDDTDTVEYTGVYPYVDVSVAKQVSNVSDTGPWYEHVEMTAGEDTVYFNVTVINTGDIRLTNVTVDDPELGYTVLPPLDPGESTNVTYSVYAMEGLNVNTVDATGRWESQHEGMFGPYYLTEYDDDTASYTGVLPDVSLLVEKTVSNVSAMGPWYEHVDVTAGEDTVYFNITVTNTGDVRLANVTVDDTELGTIVLPSLDPGEYRNLTYSVYAEEGTQVNTVDATGIWEGQYDGLHGPYSITDVGSDTASYMGVLPEVSIMVEKKVSNVSDAGPWVEHVHAIAGEDWVHFNVTVTNTGALTLYDIVVEDSLGPLTFPVSTLLPGELAWVNYSRPAESGYVINIASANGTHYTTYQGYGVVAYDIDTANYTGHYPTVEISIEKKVSNVSDVGPWVEHVEVIAGEDLVYFNVTVTNTGALTLDDIIVEDLFGPLSLPVTTLLPGASAWVNYSRPAEAGEISNIASANGTYYTTYHGYGVVASNFDTANYTGYYPIVDISVEKKVSNVSDAGPWVEHVEAIAGEDLVYFNVTVTNTGALTLDDILVEDSFGPLTLPVTTLLPGESAWVNYSRPAESGYVSNIASASGTYYTTYHSYPVIASDVDTANYTGHYPIVEISVEKKVSNSSTGPWYEHVDVIAGEDFVYFNLTVTNTGDKALQDVAMYDGYISPYYVGTLLTGESAWFNYSWPAEEGFQSNIASASGTYYTTYHNYPVVASDVDNANYTGHYPFVEISIEKKVSNVSDTGPWFELAEVTCGDLIYFNVTVTNTGAVNLSDIEIHDWNGTAWVQKSVPKSWLAPDESMAVIYNVTALAGFNENEAGAQGIWHSTYHGYNMPLWVTDTASYTGLHPSIWVDKQVYGSDGLWHDDAQVLAGETVWYRFTVENTGDMNLTGVSVLDDVLGTIAMPKTALAVGESMVSANVSGLELAQLGYHENKVNATASWNEIGVFDVDVASYTGMHPSIGVDKQVYGLDGEWHEDAEVIVGETVWYRFTVENSGDVNLTGVYVVDDVLGTIAMPKTVLSVGESMVSVNVSGLMLAQPCCHENTVNATASWNEVEVFDVDVASYKGLVSESVSESFYVAYEDSIGGGDLDYNDFGMRFYVEEIYLDGYLYKVNMRFTAAVKLSCLNHLIHIRRPINGTSTVTVVRPNLWPISAAPIFGENERPAGTYGYSGDVDVILFNTEKYMHPLILIGENVYVTITVHDRLSNPKPTSSTPPRVFVNNATTPFHDLDPMMAYYDPWLKGTDGSVVEVQCVHNTTRFGSPEMEVPNILVLDYAWWIPPWEGTKITGPYGFFDDFYRDGSPSDWYLPSKVTQNSVGYGGLTWGPYP